MKSSSPPSSALPPSSQLPPSSALPGRSSSNTPYVLGIVVFAVLIFALIYLTRNTSQPPELAQPVAKTSATQTEVEQPLNYAPPPPPEIEEVETPDAAADASASKPNGGPVATGAVAAGGPCTGCGSGIASAALKSAVSQRAGLARGCYNRALRTGAASGTLTVSVTVGSTGNVCGVGIAKDTVNSPAISQCVVNKFRGGSFPKPEVGCVVLNVPISFKMK